MGIPNFLVPALEAAKDVLRTYNRNGYDRYNFTYFYYDVLEHENIDFQLAPFRSKNLCGLYTTDELGHSILVNSLQPTVRRNFTMAHELGHHFLHRHTQGQFLDNLESIAQGEFRSRAETEANAFAAELLVPSWALNFMLDQNYGFYRIAKSTGSSYECVKWRIVSYIQDKLDAPREMALGLTDNFKIHSDRRNPANSKLIKLLSSHTYSRSLYDIREASTEYVLKGQLSISGGEREVELVSVCTNGSPYRKPAIIYPRNEVVIMELTVTINVDDNMRFTACPQCGNTQFSDEASYCKICGLHLYNHCTNAPDGWPEECGRLNPPDARYCEYCGSQTYLTQQKLLKPWNSNLSAHDDIERAYEEDPFADDDISPHISDDDLPF